jgi:hypothetical protein
MPDWKAIADRARTRLANISQEQAHAMEQVGGTVLTFAGAGVAGYIHGRRGGMPTYFGVPLDLGLAAVGGVVGLAGWAGEFSDYVLNFTNGFGAYYVGTMAAGKGQQARKDAGEFKGKEFTADEARKENVQPRAPVMAGGYNGPGFARAGGML